MSSRSSSNELSVVIPALNEAESLRRTIEGLEDRLPAASEIVVVDDGSTDGCADFLRGSRLVRLIEPEAPGVRPPPTARSWCSSTPTSRSRPTGPSGWSRQRATRPSARWRRACR